MFKSEGNINGKNIYFSTPEDSPMKDESGWDEAC